MFEWKFININNKKKKKKIKKKKKYSESWNVKIIAFYDILNCFILYYSEFVMLKLWKFYPWIEYNNSKLVFGINSNKKNFSFTILKYKWIFFFFLICSLS
jgi:hypothetical protein